MPSWNEPKTPGPSGSGSARKVIPLPRVTRGKGQMREAAGTHVCLSRRWRAAAAGSGTAGPVVGVAPGEAVALRAVRSVCGAAPGQRRAAAGAERKEYTPRADI